MGMPAPRYQPPLADWSIDGKRLFSKNLRQMPAAGPGLPAAQLPRSQQVTEKLPALGCPCRSAAKAAQPSTGPAPLSALLSATPPRNFIHAAKSTCSARSASIPTRDHSEPPPPPGSGCRGVAVGERPAGSGREGTAGFTGPLRARLVMGPARASAVGGSGSCGDAGAARGVLGHPLNSSAQGCAPTAATRRMARPSVP